ncbi:uncharacterized protein LOC113346868 [Papaver somniferum]|uniref:uncharacterized protein LOC113346868 n=1 Tax=Papaver somniferum TaxID=3469 RepID=UPI000E705943|nr:uncharacterized protein LOC113346868 [Papaver somniferum]
MIFELEDVDGNILADQEKIAYILVKFFQQKFQCQEVTVNDPLLDVIPKLITNEDQVMIEAIPVLEEIKIAVFDMNADGAPGPDSFSDIFYESCWDIINSDLLNAVQYCWKRKYIPRATRMNGLMSRLVSVQQAAYIKGRSIHEHVKMASELVNEMKHTGREGNFCKKYGFSASWCEWLRVLFSSAKISVMINGGPQGFFSMERGLKQGDPLSPLLFVLVEEVLGRTIGSK